MGMFYSIYMSKSHNLMRGMMRHNRVGLTFTHSQIDTLKQDYVHCNAHIPYPHILCKPGFVNKPRNIEPQNSN